MSRVRSGLPAEFLLALLVEFVYRLETTPRTVLSSVAVRFRAHPIRGKGDLSPIWYIVSS